MEKIRRRPKKVMEGLPIGTDIRQKVKGMVELDTELHFEIEELQYKIRDAKWKRKEIEHDLVHTFVQANMYWMFKINKTELRRFLQED